MQRQHCNELLSMLQQVPTSKAGRFVFFQYAGRAFVMQT
jgi:hypothetical protein